MAVGSPQTRWFVLVRRILLVALVSAVVGQVGVRGAAASAHIQEATVDPDDDPTTDNSVRYTFASEPETEQTKADVAAVVAEFDKIKDTEAFKRLVAALAAAGIREVVVSVIRDNPAIELARVKVRVITIDMGDWERLKAGSGTKGGTAAARGAVSGGFLQEALAHETAHLAHPTRDHDDTPGVEGIISLANPVLDEAGLDYTRLQDEPCEDGVYAKYSNDVKVNKPAPSGGWNQMFEDCVSLPTTTLAPPTTIPTVTVPSLPTTTTTTVPLGSAWALLGLGTILTSSAVVLLRRRRPTNE